MAFVTNMRYVLYLFYSPACKVMRMCLSIWGAANSARLTLSPDTLTLVSKDKSSFVPVLGCHPPSCMVIDIAVLAQGAQGQ